MTDRHDAQFRRARQAVDRTASNIDAEIGKLFDKVSKLEAVAPDNLRERLLLRLTDVLLKRVVDPIRLSFREESLVRLSSALADYRKSNPHASTPLTLTV